MFLSLFFLLSFSRTMTCASPATILKVTSTRWISWGLDWTTTATTRQQQLPRAQETLVVSASSAASSLWSMHVSVAMPTARFRPARRWSVSFSTQKAASGRRMVAVPSASSSSRFAVTMPNTARRTNVPSRSVWTSNKSSGSSSCSTGSSRPRCWGGGWPACREWGSQQEGHQEDLL